MREKQVQGDANVRQRANLLKNPNRDGDYRRTRRDEVCMGVRRTEQAWTECAGLDASVRGEPVSSRAGVKLRLPGMCHDKGGERNVASLPV